MREREEVGVIFRRFGELCYLGECLGYGGHTASMDFMSDVKMWVNWWGRNFNQ